MGNLHVLFSAHGRAYFNCVTGGTNFPPVIAFVPPGLVRAWLRRLEVFTTDAKLIRLTRRRVAFFPTAAARQLFDGDCDTADFKKFPGGDTPGPPILWAPQKREGRLPR